MRLTAQVLIPYVWGQMEVFSSKGARTWYRRCGEVKDFILVNDTIKVKLAWLAEDNVFSWAILGYDLEHWVSLGAYAVSCPVRNIRGGTSIFLEFVELDHEIILHSCGGYRLVNPELVKGFDYGRAYG